MLVAGDPRGVSLGYRDYDILYELYIVKYLSLSIIAEMFGIHPTTVNYWLKKNGIPLRSCNYKSEIGRKNMAGIGTGSKASMETRLKMSKTRKGRKVSEEARRKQSASRRGIPYDAWSGYSSFEPYCYLFNFEKKEEIRNRDNRVCQLCGKSEIENGRRLSVHHIDGDKLQGCNGKEWSLLSLCQACHNGNHNAEREFLIVANMGN